MSNHFEFLLSEKKAGKIYLSTSFGHGRKSIWCQSVYGPEYPPLMDGDRVMQPGDVTIDYNDDGTAFCRTARVI